MQNYYKSCRSLDAVTDFGGNRGFVEKRDFKYVDLDELIRTCARSYSVIIEI